MSDRNPSEINAGSMADIAFLLLIFFLVTTTLDTEIGIYKRLPEKQIKAPKSTLKEKNVFEIRINSNDEIQIEGNQTIKITDLKPLLIEFIDNGAGTNVNGEKCTWCNGKKDNKSSDHPEKAIISFQSNRNTTYATYIAVHNEILSAYGSLRNDLSKSLYGKSLDQLESDYKKDKSNTHLAENIKKIKKRYPQLISEAEPLSAN